MATKLSRVVGFLPIGASTACFKRERGFRFVVPYHDSSSGVVRERWVGRRIEDALGSELPVSPQTLAAMFQAGRIRLDGQPVAQSHIMRRQERYRVDFHRHEPEVLDAEVEVLHESEHLVAVLKPASLPVHPTGRFRKNTVLGVLEAARPDLFTPVELAVRSVHRLDRQVSGVLLLGRGRRGAKKISADLRGGRILKEYVARVRGVFPPGERPPRCRSPSRSSRRAAPRAARSRATLPPRRRRRAVRRAARAALWRRRGAREEPPRG